MGISISKPKGTDESAILNTVREKLIENAANPETSSNMYAIMNSGTTPGDMAKAQIDKTFFASFAAEADQGTLNILKSGGVDISGIKKGDLIEAKEDGTLGVTNKLELEKTGKKVLNTLDPEYGKMIDESNYILQQQGSKEQVNGFQYLSHSLGKMINFLGEKAGEFQESMKAGAKNKRERSAGEDNAGAVAAAAAATVAGGINSLENENKSVLKDSFNEGLLKLTNNVKSLSDKSIENIESYSKAFDETKNNLGSEKFAELMEARSFNDEKKMDEFFNKFDVKGKDRELVENFSDKSDKLGDNLHKLDDAKSSLSERLKDEHVNNDSNTMLDGVDALNDSEKEIGKKMKNENISDKIEEDKKLQEKIKDMVDKMMEMLDKLFNKMTGNAPSP